MNRSESINELAAALAKAQAVMAGASKDNLNPHFKSKYADLASVWDACRKPLSDNGLSVVQTATASDDGRVGVETMLMHSSGQWLSEVLLMRPVKDDPQGVGSCVTYARRYALAAVAGVAPEDDDGNAASRPTSTSNVLPMPTKPAGYDNWVLDLELTAEGGVEALRDTFKNSKAEYRDYRTRHDVARHEALKAKAAKVGA